MNTIPGIRLFHPGGDNHEVPLMVEVITRKFYERLFPVLNEYLVIFWPTLT